MLIVSHLIRALLKMSGLVTELAVAGQAAVREVLLNCYFLHFRCCSSSCDETKEFSCATLFCVYEYLSIVCCGIRELKTFGYHR